ncbi:MAG TPA: long-chain-fatty-acid--CoA ligase [Caulobacteraceae bacterium]
MLGMMQAWPLTVDRILGHAAERHGRREVVTRSLEGPIVRTTYAEVRERAKRVSNALLAMGVRPGDRVATLAWNSWRHLEVWYGIMGIGAVCHTLNPRLHPDQICWIINDAEDRAIFVDEPFAPLLESRIAAAPSVERVVVLNQDYEDLIAGYPAECAWGGFSEETACGLCYTSGTTGDPKGVLYSHRSNFLHTLMCLQPDVIGLSGSDVILPVTPMYHANAWGVAFTAPAVGAKLVLPGAKLDGASLHELLETEGVTVSCAVPTVWTGLLQYLDQTGARLTTLKRVAIGGAACPEGIIRGFHDRYGVDVRHLWGMTETSPVATSGAVSPEFAARPFAEQVPVRLKQGRAPLLCEMKITDDGGDRLAEDGHAFGRLKVRGPIVASGYFKGVGGDILDEEGFFDTGDVATIDADGVMQITDRAKDVIKSGGEWISSVEIETLAASHPKALIAAVIGVPHPKWDERPLLLVKLKPGEASTREEFLAHLEGRIAKWWTPDEVLFVEDIPLGATGKIDKKLIRAAYADYRLPGT